MKEVKAKEVVVLYQSPGENGTLYSWRYMGAYLPKKALMFAVLALVDGEVTVVRTESFEPTAKVEDVLVAQFTERLMREDPELDGTFRTTMWENLSASALARTLSGRKQLSFTDVVANIDDNVAWLRTGPETGSDAQIRICESLKSAALVDLRAREDACVTLIKELNSNWRYELLSTSPERWQFWCKVLSLVCPDANTNA